MGQFSWFTQDTNHRIVNGERHRIVMSDDKGNKWVEEQYEGYGVFGGKDFYELLAEMNGLEPDRDAGIMLAYRNHSEYHTDGSVKFPSLTESGEYFNGKAPKQDPDQGFQFQMCDEWDDWDEEEDDDYEEWDW